MTGSVVTGSVVTGSVVTGSAVTGSVVTGSAVVLLFPAKVANPGKIHTVQETNF